MTHLESTPMMPLLFLYVALVSVLITYVVTRKLLMANISKKREGFTIPLGEEELADIPEEIARQLSLMIRYVPSAGRAGAAKARLVQIEERLMLGGAPLTNWVKHEATVNEKISLDSHSIEQFSVLRLNKPELKPMEKVEMSQV